MTAINKKHIREQFGILLPRASHPEWQSLHQDMDTPNLHGHKIWNASRLLMDYLSNNPLPKNQRILDIGCGKGVTSVFCAKQFSARIIANDADPAVFPYVNFLALLNQCQINPLVCSFENISDKTLSETDIMIGADICFWDDLAESVYELIDRAINCGVKKIVIADPNRPPFIEVAEACVNEFFGEVMPWNTVIGGKITGSILLIENA